MEKSYDLWHPKLEYVGNAKAEQEFLSTILIKKLMSSLQEHDHWKNHNQTSGEILQQPLKSKLLVGEDS